MATQDTLARLQAIQAQQGAQRSAQLEQVLQPRGKIAQSPNNRPRWNIMDDPNYRPAIQYGQVGGDRYAGTLPIAQPQAQQGGGLFGMLAGLLGGKSQAPQPIAPQAGANQLPFVGPPAPAPMALGDPQIQNLVELSQARGNFLQDNPAAGLMGLVPMGPPAPAQQQAAPTQQPVVKQALKMNPPAKEDPIGKGNFTPQQMGPPAPPPNMGPPTPLEMSGPPASARQFIPQNNVTFPEPGGLTPGSSFTSALDSLVNFRGYTPEQATQMLAGRGITNPNDPKLRKAKTTDTRMKTPEWAQSSGLRWLIDQLNVGKGPSK